MYYVSYNQLVSLGLTLIFIGFFIAFLSIILLMLKPIKSEGEKSVEGGGIIIIGPLPIVFGTSKGIVKALLILAIVLFVLVLIFYYAPYITYGSR